MHSGVVCKFRTFNPNKKGTAAANKEYCVYIATRPGVDVSNVDDNIMPEVTHPDMLDNANYVGYIANRPRSHGLFGNFDFEELSNVTSEIRHLSKDGKIVYRGIISLKEEDAQELGYLNKSKWKMLLDSTMPDIGNTFGISIANLKWVAAFHKEAGHPHVHVMFWDTSNRIVSPFIHTSKQNKCRELLSAEIFKDERELLIIEKSATRDMILQSGKDILNDNIESLSSLFVDELAKQSIPDKIFNNELDSLSVKLLNLVSSLPEHGRIAYSYMPEDIKKQVDDITQELFKRKDIGRNLTKYMENSLAISKSLSTIDDKSQWITNKAYIDINRRVGNIVLKAAQNLRFSNIIPDDKLKTILENFPSSTVQQDKNDKVISELLKDNVSKDSTSIEFNEPDPADNQKRILDIFSLKHKNSPNRFYTKDYKIAKSLVTSNITSDDYSKGLSLLQKEANKNNPLALFDLGNIYSHNNGNESIADDYYRKSLNLMLEIEKSYPSAFFEYRIGKFYLNGIGVDKNPNEAFNWFSKSSNQNYQYAQATLAKMYKEGVGVERNFDTAFSLYNSACNGNVIMPYSHYDLARLYERGLGTPVNQTEAYSHYEIALRSFMNTEQKTHNSNLEYTIGSMLYNGLGCEQNTSLAIDYLERASNSSHQLAQYLLGRIYADRNSDFYNINKAVEQFTKARESGNTYAAYSLGTIFLDENSSLYNLENAIVNLKRASDAGNSYSQNLLGRLYSDSNSSFYDISNAIHYYTLSAEQGNPLAQYALGKLYLDESSPYYNLNSAIENFERSANQGNEYAQYALGKIYMDMDTDIADLSLSINYLTLAADQGNQYAQYSLGKIYSNPDYEREDLNLAINYLRDSVSQGNDLAKLSLAKIYLYRAEHRDIVQGLQLLNDSANNGNSYAQLELSKIYYYGNVVSKDSNLSNYWLQQSLSNNNQSARDFLNFKNKLSWNNIFSTSYRLITTAFNETNKESQKSSTNLTTHKKKRKKIRNRDNENTEQHLH